MMQNMYMIRTIQLRILQSDSTESEPDSTESEPTSYQQYSLHNIHDNCCSTSLKFIWNTNKQKSQNYFVLPYKHHATPSTVPNKHYKQTDVSLFV